MFVKGISFQICFFFGIYVEFQRDTWSSPSRVESIRVQSITFWLGDLECVSGARPPPPPLPRPCCHDHHPLLYKFFENKPSNIHRAIIIHYCYTNSFNKNFETSAERCYMFKYYTDSRNVSSRYIWDKLLLQFLNLNQNIKPFWGDSLIQSPTFRKKTPFPSAKMVAQLQLKIHPLPISLGLLGPDTWKKFQTYLSQMVVQNGDLLGKILKHSPSLRIRFHPPKWLYVI